MTKATWVIFLTRRRKKRLRKALRKPNDRCPKRGDGRRKNTSVWLENQAQVKRKLRRKTAAARLKAEDRHTKAEV